MTLIVRVVFLLAFAGGILWMLLQGQAADEGTEDLERFRQQMDKTQGSIDDQRKRMEEELKQQKDQ